MSHSRPRMPMPALALLVLLVGPVMAQAPRAELLNTPWTVALSKVDLGSANCRDRPSCLNRNDRVEIQAHDETADGAGSGWLVIHRDGRKLAAFQGLLRRATPTGQGADQVAFYFIDHAAPDRPAKRLKISLLPDAASDTDRCQSRLRELGRGQFSDDELQKACNAETTARQIHWSICTLDPSSNCVDFDRSPDSDNPAALSPPDDGQGTGGGTD